MSTSVDNRVVQMQFDNAQFEAGVQQSLNTLTRLDAALNDLENAGGFSGLSQAVNNIGDDFESTFSFRGVAALTTFQKIAESVINKVLGAMGALKNNYMPVDFFDKLVGGGNRRAQNLEDAAFRLGGLGVAMKDIQADIDYAVDNTAYGMDSAAKAASQLVATGVQFGETFGATGNSPMAKALRGISGVAAMTNSSYDEIANIFTTVAGNSRLLTQQLNMFSFRGLNVAATMAEQFNKVLAGSPEVLKNYSNEAIAQIYAMNGGAAITEQFIRENLRKGIVTADLFMETMNSAFGEHATKANETYAGSLANVGAALSRIGADYYHGVGEVPGHMQNMVEVFNALRQSINYVRSVLQPFTAEFLKFEQAFTHGMAAFFDGERWKEGILGPFQNLVRIVNLGVGAIREAFANVFPDATAESFANVFNKINEFAMRLEIPESTLTGIRNAFTGIFTIIKAVVDIIKSAIYIISPWFNVLNYAGALVLEVFSAVGRALGLFQDKISETKGLRIFVELMHEASRIIADGFVKALSIAILTIRMFDDVLSMFVDVTIIAANMGVEILIALFQALPAPVQTFIGSVVFGFQKLIEYANRFKNTVINTFLENGLLGALADVVDGILKLPRTIQNAFATTSLLIRTALLKSLPEQALSFFEKLISEFRLGISYAKGFGGTILNALRNADTFHILYGFEKLIEYVGRFKTSVIDAFANGGYAAARDRFIKGINNIPNAFALAFGESITTIRTRFSALLADLPKIISDVKTKLNTFGVGLFDALPKQIQTILTTIKSFATTVDSSLEKLFIGFQGFLGKVKDTFSTNGFLGVIETVKTSIMGLPKFVIDSLSPIGDAIRGAFTSKLDAAKKGWNDFVKAIQESGIGGAFDFVVKKFKAFSKSIKDAFAVLKNQTIPYLMDAITKSFNKLLEKFPFVNKIIDVIKKIRDNFIKVFETIKTYVSNLGTTMYQAGRDALMGLVKGFMDNSVVQAIYGAIKALVGSKESGTGIIGFFASLVGWHSPWTIMIAAGAAALAGLAIGFAQSGPMQAIRAALTSLVEMIKKVLAPILPYVKTLVDTLDKYLTFDNIRQGLSMTIEVIGRFAQAFANLVSTVAGKGISVLSKAKNVIVSFFTSLSGKEFNLSNLAKKIGGPFEAFYTGLTKVWGFVQKISAKMGEVGNGKFGEALQTALGIAELVGIPFVLLTFARAVDNVKSIISGVTGAFKSFIDSLNNVLAFFQGFAKAIQLHMEFNAIRKIILSIAALLGVIALAMYKIGSLDTGKFKQAMEVLNHIEMFTAAVLIAMIALTVFSKKNLIGDIGPTRTAIANMSKSLFDVALLVVGMGISLKFASDAMREATVIVNMTANNWQKLGSALLVLGVLMGMLAMATMAISRYSPKIAGGLLALIAITVILNKIMKVYRDLVGISDALITAGKKEVIDEAINTLASICLSIAGLALVVGKMGPLVGVSLLAMVVAIQMLDETMHMIMEAKYLNSTTLLNSIEQIGTIFLLMGSLFALTRLAGPNALGAAATILAIGVTLRLIVGVVSSLRELYTMIDDNVSMDVTSQLIVLFGGLAAVLYTAREVSLKSIANIFAAGTVVSSLIVVVTLITVLLTRLADVKPDALRQAQGVMIGLGVIVAGMIAATKLAEGVKTRTLVAMIGLIMTVAASLAAIPYLSGGLKNILVTAGSMIAIFGLFGRLIKQAGSIKVKRAVFDEMMILVTSFVAIAGTLIAMSNFSNMARVAGSVVMLGLVIQGLVHITKIAGNIKVKRAVFDEITVLVAALVGIAGTLIAMSNLGNMEKLAPCVLALGIIMQGLVHITKIAGDIKVKQAVFKEIGSLTSDLVAIAIGLLPLTLLGSYDKIIASTVGMSAIMFSLAAVAKIAGDIKVKAKAIDEIIELSKRLVIMAIALVPLAGLGKDWAAIASTTGGLSGIMLALAACAKIAGTVSVKTKAIDEIITLSKGLVLIALALTPLAAIASMENIIATTLSMVGIMGTLTGIAAIAGHITVKSKAISEILALAVGVCAIALALLPLAAIADIGNIIAAAASMSGVMLALSGVAFIAGNTKVNLVAVGEILLLAAGLCAIALALVPLASLPVNQITAAAVALGALIGVLAVIAGILGALSAVTGPGVLILIGLAGAMVIFATSVLIFSVAAQNFANAALVFSVAVMNLVTALNQLSETIGPVVSNIVAGFITGLVQGLMTGVQTINSVFSFMASAVMTGAQLLWQVFGFIGDTIISILTSIWNAFGTLGDLIVTGAQNVITSLVTFFTVDLPTAIGSFISTLGELISSLDIGGMITSLGNAILDLIIAQLRNAGLFMTEETEKIIRDFIATLVRMAAGIPKAIGNIITTTFDAIRGGVKSNRRKAEGEVDEFGAYIVSSTDKNSRKVETQLNNSSKRITASVLGSKNNGVLSIPGKMAKAGVDGVAAFATGFGAGSGMVEKSVETVVGSHKHGGAFFGTFDKCTGWGSLWTTLLKAGEDGSKALAAGLSGAISFVSKAASTVGGTVVSNISTIVSNGLSKIGGRVGQTVGKIWNTVQNDGVDGLLTLGKDWLKEKVDGAKETAQEIVDSFAVDLPDFGDLGDVGGGSGGGGSAEKKSAKEMAEEALRHEKAVRLQNEAVKEFINAYGVCLGLMEDSPESVSIATNAIQDLARTFGLTEDEVADTEAEIEDLFMDMYDSIYESVEGSISMFEKFSVEASIAPEMMLNNMRSNIRGAQEFAQELQWLSLKGFSRQLVEDLAAEGPAAQAQVRTFLKMTYGQMMEANALYAQKTEVISEATVKAITAIAFAGKTQEYLIKVATDGTDSLESRAAQAALAAADHMSKVIVTYRELRDTVAEVVESQMDIFSKFEKKTEVSAQDMLDNMKSQIDGVTEWATMLDTLAKRGIDEGLLLRLKDMGPQGYETIHAFTEMTGEQLQKANEYFRTSLTLPDTIANQVSTSYLNTGMKMAMGMVSGVVEKWDEVNRAVTGTVEDAKAAADTEAAKFEETGRNTDKAYAEGIDNNAATAVTASAQMATDATETSGKILKDGGEDNGRQGVQGVARGIRENASVAVAAAMNLAQSINAEYAKIQKIKSPSRVWAEFGKYQDEGLALGMLNNVGTVVDASQSVADNSVNALSTALDKIVDDDFNAEINPVITPVLDLSDVESGMGYMNSMLNSSSPYVKGITSNISGISLTDTTLNNLANAINGMRSPEAPIGTVNITINTQPGQNSREIADMTLNRLNTQIRRRRAAIS